MREPPIAAIDAAAARAWPASHTQLESDGWLLRATPGLDRGRCNNALPPGRPVGARELAHAIERIEAFAARHGTRAGIQVSPLPLHAPIVAELDRRGWETQLDVVMMTAPIAALAADDARVVSEDRATAAWCEAWSACDPAQDLEAHRRTVFAELDGRAAFARLGNRATAIGVADGELVGLFSVATAVRARRQGLGAALVRAIAARSGAGTAYLQVESGNAAGIAFWTRLGFRERYRYVHRQAPAPADSGTSV